MNGATLVLTYRRPGGEVLTVRVAADGDLPCALCPACRAETV
ncbi:hypothetical protein [Bailinhaonella thermotolerans]|nr:hypothetical protein [Bailinhaonella thermotolerans]